MRDVYVIVAHTIKFGKYFEKTIADLSAMTVLPCLKEACLMWKRLPFAFTFWKNPHCSKMD